MYLQTLKVQISLKNFLLIFFIALIYLLFAAYILNYRLFINTILGMFPLGYKFSLLSSLLVGLYTAMSSLDFYLLIITSTLVGINFVLLFATLKKIKQTGSKVHFLVGGGSLLSIATIGCTTCGLTLLSVLGLGAAFAFISFVGMVLYIISILALVSSIFYMLRKLNQALVCEIPPKG